VTNGPMNDMSTTLALMAAPASMTRVEAAACPRFGRFFEPDLAARAGVLGAERVGAAATGAAAAGAAAAGVGTGAAARGAWAGVGAGW